MCFTIGMGMLFYSAFGIIEGLTSYQLLMYSSIFSFIYSIWAMASFFDANRISVYIKSFGSYMLGLFSFVLSIVAIGLIIEILN
jgi:hypothetical protein